MSDELEGPFQVSQALVDFAAKSEGATIVEGKTASGLPVLIIVAVGANVGIFKQYAGDVLPDWAGKGKAR